MSKRLQRTILELNDPVGSHEWDDDIKTMIKESLPNLTETFTAKLVDINFNFKNLDKICDASNNFVDIWAQYHNLAVNNSYIAGYWHHTLQVSYQVNSESLMNELDLCLQHQYQNMLFKKTQFIGKRIIQNPSKYTFLKTKYEYSLQMDVLDMFG